MSAEHGAEAIATFAAAQRTGRTHEIEEQGERVASQP